MLVCKVNLSQGLIRVDDSMDGVFGRAKRTVCHEVIDVIPIG